MSEDKPVNNGDNNSVLVGYIRMSKKGGALKLSIDAEAIANAEKYKSADGREYISVVVNATRARQILAGERDVTSISQLTGPLPAKDE